MSQKIYRNQKTLESATINPCNPDISLMTEHELRDTCLKKMLKEGGGCRGRIDYTRLFIFFDVKFKFLYICVLTSFINITNKLKNIDLAFSRFRLKALRIY